MSEHYADQDQVEALKAWWKEYGTAIIIGIVSGALLIGGYRYWDYYKTTKNEEASAIYEKILDDVSSGRLSLAEESTKKLISDFTISPYPAISSLLLAKKYVDIKNYNKTKEYLQKTIDVANDQAIIHVARLRMARIIFFQEGKAQEAMSLLENVEPNGFSSQYDELKGDILMSSGNTAEAINSYGQALASNNSSGEYRTVLQMKLDDAKSK